jgi:intein-encoded DNA endonuclease-like protein
MNILQNTKLNLLKKLALVSIILLTSTNSLAEPNLKEKIYTQEGYPYAGLVERSEEVSIFYTKGEDNVSCRVEVSQHGQVWKGEKHSTSLKKFTQKPLRVCMDRVDAKKLLANTF